VDRACIARILETESQLRSCHKTVPFKLFSNNLGVSMCSQVYAWILYMYNILLEHNTVEKTSTVFLHKDKAENVRLNKHHGWSVSTPIWASPSPNQQPSALGQTYVLCMCLTAVKIKFSFFFSRLTIALTYLNTYFTLYIYFFYQFHPSENLSSLHENSQRADEWRHLTTRNYFILVLNALSKTGDRFEKIQYKTLSNDNIICFRKNLLSYLCLTRNTLHQRV